jgi:hypothetical protein
MANDEENDLAADPFARKFLGHLESETNRFGERHDGHIRS